MTTSSAHAPAGVLRIATLTARNGAMPALIDAARTNAAEAAAQPGCLSADVCRVPDDPMQLVVASRWRSQSDLSAFLNWHEGIAHELIAHASSVEPRAVHYPAPD